MKVKVKKLSPDVTLRKFKVLDVGEVFIFQGIVYLKTTFHTDSVNCLALEDLTISTINSDTLVSFDAVEAEITIKSI